MPKCSETGRHVVIIGAGFTGLSAAFELGRAGVRTTVIEADSEIGGLAGSLSVGGSRLEKFYHHWFASDRHITELTKDLGTSNKVRLRSSRTGTFFANSIFRLSRPIDVLRYTPLSILGRVRLGLLVAQAKLVRDWHEIESQTAFEWLKRNCGEEVFEVVWRPLLTGKFGVYASEISAVWFWNKLMLRGGSRDKAGQEVLAYYDGGFSALTESLANAILSNGGQIITGRPVTDLLVERGNIRGVIAKETILADTVICTTPVPIFSALIRRHVNDAGYLDRLNRIRFLGNVCMIMELNRSLSDTYWLNVSDPSFPFVGLIEHTNFEPKTSYGGRHIVYLSKYLPTEDELYKLNSDQFLEYALPFITRIFPNFNEKWVTDKHLYRAPYSQPLITCNYSSMVPSEETPVRGLFLRTMAQVYPEDRGTNFAIRDGRAIGRRIASQ